MNKVFGIGLPKTGTSSLTAFLTSNGINTLHFGNNEANEIREKIYRGIFKFDVLEKYDGLTNCGENYFEQFDINYPGSKFILTTRDKEEWLSSIERHWDRMISAVGVSAAMRVHHHLITFGCYLFNKDRFSYVYDYTHDMIYKYFRNRPNDLYILDISDNKQVKHAGPKLCNWLNIECKNPVFPIKNVGVR